MSNAYKVQVCVLHESEVSCYIALRALRHNATMITTHLTSADYGQPYTCADTRYGTDAIPEDDGATRDGGAYNPIRGAKVIEFARRFLDQAAPLSEGSHAQSTMYVHCFPRCVSDDI